MSDKREAGGRRVRELTKPFAEFLYEKLRNPELAYLYLCEALNLDPEKTSAEVHTSLMEIIEANRRPPESREVVPGPNKIWATYFRANGKCPRLDIEVRTFKPDGATQLMQFDVDPGKRYKITIEAIEEGE